MLSWLLLWTTLGAAAPGAPVERTGLGAYVDVTGLPAPVAGTTSGTGLNVEFRSGLWAVSVGIGGSYLYREAAWRNGLRAQLHLIGRRPNTWEVAVGAGPFDGFSSVGWALDGTPASIASSFFVGYRWEEPVAPFLLFRAGLGWSHESYGLIVSLGWQGPSHRRARR